MRKVLTPNDIEVLLHFHTTGMVHPRADAPAVHDATCMWVNAGMLEAETHGVYRTTPSGKAMVEALCRTPAPVLQYIDAVGNVVYSEKRKGT
jgi:hypothetical protein